MDEVEFKFGGSRSKRKAPALAAALSASIRVDQPARDLGHPRVATSFAAAPPAPAHGSSIILTTRLREADRFTCQEDLFFLRSA
jgi:hypothetical protein